MGVTNKKIIYLFWREKRMINKQNGEKNSESVIDVKNMFVRIEKVDISEPVGQNFREANENTLIAKDIARDLNLNLNKGQFLENFFNILCVTLIDYLYVLFKQII